MIEYIGRDGEPEAMLCPAFICDCCREQVTSGMVIHGATYIDGKRYATPLYVAHRGTCLQKVEALFRMVHPQMGYCTLTEDIHTFVKHLGFNATNAFEDDPDGTYKDHTVLLPDMTRLSHKAT